MESSITTPIMYLGGPEFQSWPSNQLCWLRS